MESGREQKVNQLIFDSNVQLGPGVPVDLTGSKSKHILEGDQTGGGHRPGTGISGKPEFPAGWSDDKILHEISDVVTDPKSTVAVQGKTQVIEGVKDGVNIRVIVRDGKIVTGYTTNLPRNK